MGGFIKQEKISPKSSPEPEVTEMETFHKQPFSFKL